MVDDRPPSRREKAKRRWEFWIDAADAGWRWLRGGLDDLGRALLVLFLFLGFQGIVLATLGIRFVVTVAALVLLAAVAEGAYRVWDRTDRKRESAQRALEAEHSRDALVHRLEVFAQECELLKAEAPADDVNPADRDGADSVFADTFRDLIRRVDRELRLYAGGFLGYWRTNPPDVSSDFLYVPSNAAQKVRMLDYSKGQLEHIIDALNQGKDAP